MRPLEEILADKYEFEYIRGGAAWALGRIGKAARPAVPLLIDTLTSKHVSVRRNSPLALAAIGGDEAKKAVARHRQTAGRRRCRRAGGGGPGALAFGPRSACGTQAGPRCSKRARARRPTRRSWPWASSARMRDGLLICPATRSILLANCPSVLRKVDSYFVADPGSVGRGPASRGQRRPPRCRKVAGRYRSAGPAGDRKNACRQRPRTSREAAEALGFLGPPAIPALIAALRHADPQVRRIAARALGRLGPEAGAARPALVEAVSDPDPAVRDTAAEALKRVVAAAGSDN